MIEADPSIHLDEHRYELAIVHNVHATITTISHTLSRVGLTREAVLWHVSKRNDTAGVWEVRMARNTDADMFVFLDEDSQRSSGFAGK